MLQCWRRFGNPTLISTMDLIPIFTQSPGQTSSWGSRRMATSPTPSGLFYSDSWWMKISCTVFFSVFDLFSADMNQLFSPPYFQIQFHICCFTFAEPPYLRLTCLNLLHYFNCATSFISLQPQFISFWITLLKIHLDRYSLSTQNFDHKWVIKWKPKSC